jgi:hypothetical protein
MTTSLYPAMDSDDTLAQLAPRRTRIDAPHGPTDADPAPPLDAASPESWPLDAAVADPVLLEIEEEPTDAMIAAVSGDSPEIRREQLQLQVAQLAGHLRERLREVDRREATLNARASQLEADLRASRMWIREREVEFQERENELRRQIEELQERAAPRTEGETSELYDAETRLAELNEREQQLSLRENEMRERRFEVERQAAAIRHGQQLWEQQRSRQQRDLALSREQLTLELDARAREREAALESGEAMLVEHALQLDRERAALLADRQAWELQRTREREAIEDLRASAEGELADRRTRLEARQDWVERQRVGLEQVRNEALSLHRQSIEMRLLAEQLWSQITSRLSPAEVTQSLAQLRVKLADHYRLEEEQLAARKNELVELGERIAAQHEELVQLRSGLRDWAAARQTEIEQQAAALVQRELALDSKEDGFRQDEHAWQSDRRRYEQQIRDLTHQLRALPAAA